jgi:hypothetical protein
MSSPAADSHADDRGDNALKRHLSDLQRYAGWLSKDHVSVVVRADAQALGVAMDQGSDPSPWLQTLDKDIQRLPSGGLRKMLRRTFVELRTVLEASGVDGKKGERP